MFSYLALSLLLTGCPEPVGSNGSATSDKSDPGAGQNPTDPSGDAVKPHTMGTCSGDGSGEQTDPKFTQTQLADGGLITGYVQCPKKCMGQILINAMNPPPLDDSQTQPKEEMNRLITQTIIEESAIEKKDNFSTRFSIRVPNKRVFNFKLWMMRIKMVFVLMENHLVFAVLDRLMLMEQLKTLN